MITLKSVQLENFLSHAATIMEFRDGQKLLIDGKSGSGKSGIVEGIIWCLYGRSRSDNNRNLIKHSKPAASVVLELADGDTIYKIDRTITRSGRHVIAIEKDGTVVPVAGIKGAQEYIQNEILHSSYLLFINSIAYPQDNVENFVKQPADKRKDIILEIIKADAYDKYYEKTREAIIDRQNKTIISTEKLAFLEQDLKNTKENASGLKEVQDRLKIAQKLAVEAQKEVDALDMTIRSIEVKKEAAAMLKKSNTEHWASIDIFRDNNKGIVEKMEEIEKTDLASMEVQIATIPEVEKQVKELETLEIAASKWSEKYNELLRNRPIDKDYDSLIEDLNLQIAHLDAEKVDNCPELDKPCPILTSKQAERKTDLDLRMVSLVDRARDHQLELDKYDQEITALGSRPMTDASALLSLRDKLIDLYGVKTNYDHYADKQKVLDEMQKQIENNNEQIARYTDIITGNEAKIAESDKEVSKLKDYTDQRIQSKTRVTGYQSDITLLSTDISIKESAARKVDEVEIIIKKMREDGKETVTELESLALLKEAFGPRGIKTIVVDYVIPRLEDKINEILAKLSDFSVKLDTQQSGVKGDTTLEGLFITIVNDRGEEFDYNNYSGGEKLKITVAITEALAEIQKISFRILDELFVGLDEESTESFVEVMDILNSRFSQMLCITHLRDVKETFAERVTVAKVNGTSKII